jgi:PQQ-like domain
MPPLHPAAASRWTIRLATAALLGAFLAARLQAAHPFLCCDYNNGRVSEVTADGNVVWDYACKNPQDVWRLKNGNTLLCFATGAREVTRDKKVVWEYTAPAGVEVHSCEPIPDGRVMVVECGTSRIVEIDRQGRIAHEIKLVTAPSIAVHNQFRGARRLPNGHYVVTFKGEGKIVEVDRTGRVVSELKVPGDPHEVIPLRRGHLLVTCGDGHKVLEVDAHGKMVWELNENDVPGNTLRLMAGAQRLPNGNTLCCNYLGHGHLGEQPHFFEITPDKKLVWQFNDHTRFKTINQVFLLDVPGDPARGRLQR